MILNLSDYKKISTPFCFFDESGTLGVETQPYFTVGMIKCSFPYHLQREIRHIREKNRFWWEFKFNSLNKVKRATVMEVLDAFFNSQDAKFFAYSIDKREEYFRHEFNSDPFVAYEQITEKLIDNTLFDNEVLTILADDVVTPRRIKFEEDVERHVNDKFKRLAVAGVCRLDSRTCNMLQLVDLFIGAINYEMLLKEKIVESPAKHKWEVIQGIHQRMGVTTLTEDFKSEKIFIDFHGE